MSFAKSLQEKLGPHKTGEVLLKIILIFLIINLQIQELILDQLFTIEKFTEDHKKTLENYASLIHLTLNNVGLTTLDNFPNLKKAQIVRNNIINIFFRLNLIRTN